MKFVVRALLLSLLSVLGSTSATGPVERVVTLLQELKQRLQADNTDEQAAFDKYACWCEETTSRKAASIEGNRAELTSLGQDILTRKSTVAEKTLEVRETMAEIQENEQSQQLATTIRQKENAAYQAETVETKQAIDALERATLILRDATSLLQQGQTGQAFLQKARHAFAELSGVLAAAPDALLARFEGGSSRLQLLSRFSESLDSGSKARYTPQSMTVQGILKDLYDTFAADLQSKHAEEARLSTAYENLIATKQQEIIELHEKIQKAEKVKVEAETMLTEALQTYGDTEEQLKGDVAFFDATKSACTARTQDWAGRKSLRAEELSGISEALTILTSDEAKELFGKAIQPGVGSFLQVASMKEVARSKPAQQAVKALRQHAAEAHSLRLAAVAAQVQLAAGGHFDEVIASIDTMMGVLQTEGAGDLAIRDKCRQDLHDIASKTEDISWKINVNVAEIAKLGEVIERMEAEEAKTIEDIQLVTQQISDLTSNRTQENTDFQAAKEDDVKAVQLLEEAKDALAKYYANHSVDLGPTESGRAALLEVGNDDAAVNASGLRGQDDAPDMDFAHKGKRKHETKGIVALLETIIEDLNTEVANGVKAEEEAQLQYEAQKKAAEDLESTLQTKKANLASDVALRKSERTDEEGKKTTNQNDLDDQVVAKQGIEPDCSAVESKFEDREAKREAEMEGLRQAKEYLAGYQVSQGDGSDAPGGGLLGGAALIGEAKGPQVARLRGLAPVGRHVA